MMIVAVLAMMPHHHHGATICFVEDECTVEDVCQVEHSHHCAGHGEEEEHCLANAIFIAAENIRLDKDMEASAVELHSIGDGMMFILSELEGGRTGRGTSGASRSETIHVPPEPPLSTGAANAPPCPVRG